jgi:integrase
VFDDRCYGSGLGERPPCRVRQAKGLQLGVDRLAQPVGETGDVEPNLNPVRQEHLRAARSYASEGAPADWVNFANRRVVWPDSKIGEISKPMSEDVVALLVNAPRLEGSPYVVPSIFKADRPMSQASYSRGWRRILERAKVPHVGTHGIRHRATTEIANSGVPVKVGMQLTAHKTVTQFSIMCSPTASSTRQS